MRGIISIAITLVLAGPLFAGASRFEEANGRFKSGDFAGAAALYQEVLASEGPSAAVLFDLGNCEQRLGHYGPAILAYERARLLAPRDPDLRANLELARKAAAVFEEPGRFPRLDGVLDYLSLNEWSWLVAGGALALGGLAVLRGLVSLPKRWMVVCFRSTAGLALFVILCGVTALYLRRGEHDRGVVLSENATVRLSPFETAEGLGTPGPGRMVHIRRSEGGFHFIEVPGTELKGWMADKDVGAIQTRRFEK